MHSNLKRSSIISRPTFSPSSSGEIRSKFLQKLGIDSMPPQVESQMCTSPQVPCQKKHDLIVSTSGSTVGECILRLEPLKIGLESDESSIESQESYEEPPLSTAFCPSSIDQENTKKKRNRSNSLNFEEHKEKPMEDVSGHSLPSLASSDLSLGCSPTYLSGSALMPNKKARTLNRKKKPKSVSMHSTVSVVSIPSRVDYTEEVRAKIWTPSHEIQANAARNTIEFCSENWDWKNVLEDDKMFIHQHNGERVHPIHVHNAMEHIKACEGEPGNEEDIQLNLSLISCLLPPASSSTKDLPAAAAADTACTAIA
jgi:hypothetical protein